jgi:polyhydroxyalkanoate synthesis regulator phasin
MSTQAQTLEDEKKEEKHSPFYQTLRKLTLAAVGATMIAQEEVDSFLSRMAERGEIAEKDARRLMREAIERREKAERERKAQAAQSRPAVATKADVEALAARIAELSQKLEELKKAQE